MTRNVARPLLLLLLLACTLTATGCNSIRDISIFSTEQEKELGQKVSQEIESQVTLLNDPRVVSYVRNVGDKVAAQSQREDIEYTFKVIDNPKEVNAFAVPGGHIYIYTGLLGRMNTEAELAAVLAHETAHIEERHSMEALTRQVGFNIVLDAVLGEAAAWQQVLANVGTNIAFLKFSREDEKEADLLGVQFMSQAGYAPQGMVNLLELFLSLQATEPSAVQIWLSSHPTSKKRIELVQDYIAKENLHGGVVDEQQYLNRMQPVIREVK